MGKYAWDAAFVAYCNGAPLAEVSGVFHIPLESLKQHMAECNWRALRAKLPLVTNSSTEENLALQKSGPGLPAVIGAKLAVIEANRKINLQVFEDARDHLIEQVRALKEGRLELEKVFCTKGVITRAMVKPGPGDWVNIASYAQQIAQGTYRALGDLAAQDKAGQDASGGHAQAPSQAAITIILPAPVAAPRGQRAVEEASAPATDGQPEIIDVSSSVTPSNPKL